MPRLEMGDGSCAARPVGPVRFDDAMADARGEAGSGTLPPAEAAAAVPVPGAVPVPVPVPAAPVEPSWCGSPACREEWIVSCSCLVASCIAAALAAAALAAAPLATSCASEAVYDGTLPVYPYGLLPRPLVASCSSEGWGCGRGSAASPHAHVATPSCRSLKPPLE